MKLGVILQKNVIFYQPANTERRSGESGERRTQKPEKCWTQNAEAGQVANAERRSGASGEHRREKYLSATVCINWMCFLYLHVNAAIDQEVQ